MEFYCKKSPKISWLHFSQHEDDVPIIWPKTKTWFSSHSTHTCSCSILLLKLYCCVVPHKIIFAMGYRPGKLLHSGQESGCPGPSALIRGRILAAPGPSTLIRGRILAAPNISSSSLPRFADWQIDCSCSWRLFIDAI